MRSSFVGRDISLLLKSGKIQTGILRTVYKDEVIIRTAEEDGEEQDIVVYKDEVAVWKPLDSNTVEFISLYVVRCMNPACAGIISFNSDLERAKAECSCKEKTKECKQVASSFADMDAETQVKVLDGHKVIKKARKKKANAKNNS